MSFNYGSSTPQAIQLEKNEYGCFACNKLLVEPLRLPFCATNSQCHFCYPCLKSMFKTSPLRVDCPSCHQKFETPESPEILATYKEKMNNLGEFDLTPLDPVTQRLYDLVWRKRDIITSMQLRA